jgi:hypothetical protein
MSAGFRPIQIRVYGSKGEPVIQWSSCEGYLKDLKLFDSVPPKIVNGVNTELTLAEDLSRYFTLDGKPANIEPPPGYDYYILIYFAKFFPRMSKESFRQIQNFRVKFPELKCKIYKINVDVLEFWGVELNSETEIHVGGDK